MSNKTKDINIKNHTHYFFDDNINIKNFDSNGKLPVNKMTQIPSMIIVVTVVFHESNKY